MFREMRRARQALSREECEDILRRGTSGVLAVTGDGGWPYAVPLSYCYRDGKLWFHCARAGQKLENLAARPRACFSCVLYAENRKAFRYLLSLSPAPALWAAWGNIIEKRGYLMDCLRDFAADAQAAGAAWFTAGPLLKSGHPHHPLYLKGTTPLQGFDISAYLTR